MMSDASNPSRGNPAPAKVVIERTYRADVQELWELWTTKEGFESWWGPEGFRVEVQALEARPGGALQYEMIAATPEMIEEMRKLGQPISHGTRGRFTEVAPPRRLVITHVIDFLPGVTPYEQQMLVEFFPSGDRVRMVVTLDAMHSPEFGEMQQQGFTSSLGKLDKRFQAA